jgi:hypothetical protein
MSEWMLPSIDEVGDLHVRCAEREVVSDMEHLMTALREHRHDGDAHVLVEDEAHGVSRSSSEG